MGKKTGRKRVVGAKLKNFRRVFMQDFTSNKAGLDIKTTGKVIEILVCKPVLGASFSKYRTLQDTLVWARRESFGAASLRGGSPRNLSRQRICSPIAKTRK